MIRPGAVDPPAAVPAAESAFHAPAPPASPAPEGTARRSGRRHPVLLGLLLGLLLAVPACVAGVVSAVQPTRYAAEVELLHEPEDATTVDGVDREMATHSVLLQRRLLVGETAAAIGRSTEDLTDDLSVEVVEGSSVLRLQVVDTDPDRARAALEELVDRYLASAERLAVGSDIGRLRALAPPTVLDEPAGPQPLRAAAAGLLLGLVLVAGVLGLRRFRRGPSGTA